jgi:hypothetical protein
MIWRTPSLPAAISRSGHAGRRRPASGVVYQQDVVLTARALGREMAYVRRADGTMADAELAGWDPATGLAVLRSLVRIERCKQARPARVSHLGISVARSWVTTSPQAPGSWRSSPVRWRQDEQTVKVIHERTDARQVRRRGIETPAG